MPATRCTCIVQLNADRTISGWITDPLCGYPHPEDQQPEDQPDTSSDGR